MRTTAILSTIVLSVGLVAGCGSDGDGGNKSNGNAAGSGGSYCDQLKDAKESFDTLDSGSGDFGQLEKAIDTFHELADNAPSEVEAEWESLDGAFTSMESALDDAGLTFEDLASITAGQLPEGMTASELQALTPKLEKAFSDLDGEKFEAAGEKIEAHAKSECGIELDDSGSDSGDDSGSDSGDDATN